MDIEMKQRVEAALHEVRTIQAQASLLAKATNQSEGVERNDLRVAAWQMHLSAGIAERKLGELLAQGATA